MARPQTLTTNQEDVIVAERARGRSWRDAGKAAGCHATTAQRLVERRVDLQRRIEKDGKRYRSNAARQERRRRRAHLAARGIDPESVLEPGDLHESVQRIRDHRAGRPLKEPDFDGARARAIAATGTVKVSSPVPSARPRRRRRGFVSSFGTVLASPLDMERARDAVPWAPVSEADQVAYLEARSRRVTLRSPDRKRVMYVDPRDDLYVALVADGWG